MTTDMGLLGEYTVLASSMGNGQEKVGEKRGLLQIGVSDGVTAGRNEIFISLHSSLKLRLALIGQTKAEIQYESKCSQSVVPKQLLDCSF